MEDGFDAYNQRIESMLHDEAISDRACKAKGPAGRFKMDDAENWEPMEHPGYTVITPSFEDESHNVKTYARLGDIQHVLLKQLTLSKLAPAPVTAFHITVADLVAGEVYKNRVKGASEQELLQALSSIFSQLILAGPMCMKVLGVSLFTSGFIIAVVGAVTEEGYERLVLLRNAIYRDERLRALGVERKFKFTGHITLAYVEEALSRQDQGRLAGALMAINQRFFDNPLPLYLARAEVRKFDNMLGFYRQGGWPVLEFV